MIVASLGLEGSGSTWLYNVVREIAKLRHARVYNVQSTNLFGLQKRFVLDGRVVHEHDNPRLEEADAIVVKAHSVESELFWTLRAAGCPFVLSLRDPRDSVASMMARLGSGEQAASANLVRSLSAIMSARTLARNMMLSYETRFFERAETVGYLAEFLGVELAASRGQEIFQRYTRDNVRAFVQNLRALPPERAFRDAGGWYSDRDTQFNEHHLGDARSGKWREVVRPILQDAVERCFGEVAGKLELGPAFVLRFPECLFSPVALDHKSPYRPERAGAGVRMLKFCWLPRGRWHVVVRGGFPAAGKLMLRVGQNGGSLHAEAIEPEDSASFAVAFDADIRVFDRALDLTFEGEGIGELDAMRPNAIEMSAQFLAAIP